MRKPKPHGPYSAEELSNMDDSELGRLYREKNRFKETVWPLWLPFLFALGALCGLIPSMIMGIIYHFRFAWLIFAFCATVLPIWYLVSIPIKKRKRHNREEDAFDDLYPHEDEDDFKKAFDYLCYAIDEETENKDNSLNKWISRLKKISSDDGSGYTDAELGQLLKIIIPILSYMKESGHNIQDTDFEALDKEFNLTKQLNDFMDTSYAEMHDRTKREREAKLKAENDNKREKAKQLAAKIKDKNKKYTDGLAELEKSADYRKMMDLKRTLDEKKKKLSEQVKTEKQKPNNQ